MVLEMVGVKLDQARDDIVAFHVLAGADIAGIDRGDDPVAHQHRAGHHLVAEHDTSVSEREFAHWRPPR